MLAMITSRRDQSCSGRAGEWFGGGEVCGREIHGEREVGLGRKECVVRVGRWLGNEVWRNGGVMRVRRVWE